MLRANQALSPLDVQEAAALALDALENGESRAQRIARVRRTHARAFTAWEQDEDARLVEAFSGGARVADLAREFERPPGAIRMRLARLLGDDWREAAPQTSGGESESARHA